jgi:hypothetical protein
LEYLKLSKLGFQGVLSGQLSFAIPVVFDATMELEVLTEARSVCKAGLTHSQIVFTKPKQVLIIVIPSLIGVLDGVLQVSAEREQKGLAISSVLVFFSFSVNVNADKASKDLSLSSGHNADSGTLVVDILVEGIKVAAMKGHSVEVDESELSVSEPLVEHVVLFGLVNES